MNNLRELRIDRNLSQQKLAEIFSLSQQSIYKYENNLAEPDIHTLKKFASFFHTTVDYLIGYKPKDVLIGYNTKFQITPGEAHFLRMYRNLNPATRNHIDAILEELGENNSSC